MLASIVGATALLVGFQKPVDPINKTWKIVAGKLYLNYNQDVKKKWEQDIPGHIKKADENWPRLSKQ
jgi:hypothetical protein